MRVCFLSKSVYHNDANTIPSATGLRCRRLMATPLVLFCFRVYFWIKNGSHIGAHFVVLVLVGATFFKKSLSLLRFKSDQDEI